MVAVWMGGVVVGLLVAVIASSRALENALMIASRLGVSPFIIGVTVLAIGTDLPEIANSIWSSATERGDLNVGDSIGSVVTQMTLVLGLVCFTGRVRGSPRRVLTGGGLTVAALFLSALLVADEELGRIDALFLLVTWGFGTYVLAREGPVPSVATVTDRAVGRGVAELMIGLAVVGAGAMLAVECFSRAADDLGIPQYLASFFILALGTSLPELVVSVGAVRRGETSLAMGDLLGASFADATLSLGSGPLLFPIVVDADATRGSIVAAITVAIVIAVLSTSTVHKRSTGIVLFLLYASLYVSLLT